MRDERLIDVFGLDGKTALITGGGTGLGAAMAKAFLLAGAKVVITGRRREVLDSACQSLGPGASGIVCDVTDTSCAPKLAEGIVKQMGSLDILVNNAGVHSKKPMEQITQEELKRIMDVHVFGAYALTQAAVPYMKKAKGGSIIFISSMSACIGMTNVTAYSAAKSAVLGLTRTMAGELSGEGVRVNAIVPGFIDTPMFHQAVDLDPDRQAKILGHTPMKRYGTPEDIGWAALYLASKASEFVTGTTLMVDGGCSIGF
ncbi:SDR family NAD(P)-dependent oxidoreductase [Enterocloster citroniae]|uniref:SDR family NAD(P)-dependent oxidoreductase n=1 Tax=Enterocloster citroniae TaxID=358743 RepID=UPI00349EA73E